MTLTMDDVAQLNDWRQGDVLTTEGAKTLGLSHPTNADDTAVVIISHDCDIVQHEDIEPTVEAIVGREIAASDGNYQNGKSSRTLHLPFTAGSDPRITIELSAMLKCQIRKIDLFKQHPTLTVKPSAAERRTLQRWLSSRYFRSAFPDEFVARLSKYGIDERLKRIFAGSQGHLFAVYADLDAGADVERNGDADLYTLSIYLIHAAEPDLAASARTAESAKAKIEGLFDERCKKDGKWFGIELEGCYAYSMQEMTLFVAEKLRRWNTDYLSLRQKPHGPMIGESA